MGVSVKIRRSNVVSGFTVLEVLIVLVIVGMLVAISIPTLNSLTGVNLDSSARQMQGLIRDVYTKAALSGKTHRIVYGIGNNWYKVEYSTDNVKMKSSEDKSDIPDTKDDDALFKKPGFLPVEGEMGEKATLASGVVYRSIWVEHLDKREAEGTVEQYFFPGGYAEECQLTLALSKNEADKDIQVVVTEPLTGDSYIVSEEPEIKR